MSANTAVPPPVSWAQRNDLLFVIVNVECKDVEYKFTEDSMYFKGTSIQGNKLHEVTLNFLHKINPDKVTSKNISRCLEFTIYKAESGPYWPTLTSDKKKPHFLKVDFNKWVDEGSDEEIDHNDLFGNLGRLHEGGDKPSVNDLFAGEEDEEEDSDDEQIPPLVSDSNKE
uniref:Putative hsp90 co-chaperone p23 n=1 Tax=Tabanus bromius TaxID=304241 RepID=A0A0K8TPP8_TABBR